MLVVIDLVWCLRCEWPAVQGINIGVDGHIARKLACGGLVIRAFIRIFAQN